MGLELITIEPKSKEHSTPILFIHGAWHGAWCWNEFFLPYFAENGYTSHALSLRGHGKSDKTKSLRCTRISDYVDDVSQVVKQMPQEPVLVGHGMGGLIVQKYLELNSAPAGVLLASVPPRGVSMATLGIALRHPWAFLKLNITLSLYPIIERPMLAKEAFFSSHMTPDTVIQYTSRMQDESYLAFLDMLAFDLPRPEKVNTDLLVMGAENDTLISVNEVKKTAQAYGKNAEIVSGMAHDMMLEPGWKDVADRIIDWLRKKKL